MLNSLQRDRHQTLAPAVSPRAFRRRVRSSGRRWRRAPCGTGTEVPLESRLELRLLTACAQLRPAQPLLELGDLQAREPLDKRVLACACPASAAAASAASAAAAFSACCWSPCHIPSSNCWPAVASLSC